MKKREKNQKITLSLGVTDLSFHRATSAVVALVLEHMGYEVDRSFAPHELNFERLRLGEIDMLASAWLPSSHGVYRDRVNQSTQTLELGLHYEPYAMWGVPDYVPSSEVSSVDDLLKPSVRQQMNRRIQGIGPGAGITRFSIKMMEEYKLSESGYSFFTGTQDDCVAAFEEALSKKQWAIVPLWHPQFLHAIYPIRELRDPRGLLGGKDRAVLLARRDSLAKLEEEEIQVLNRIKLSNDIVSALDYKINREQKTDTESAQEWISRHSDHYTKWFEST